MSIIRTKLAFEDHFTQIPNEYLRDERISLRARGLLALIFSHSIGWQLTIETLAEHGPEGRDAIRTAVKELEAVGYLRRERQRSEDGTLGGVDFYLQEPEQTPVDTYDGFSNVGSANVGESDTKNTIPKEEQSKESISPTVSTPPEAGRPAVTDGLKLIAATKFEEFWSSYPKQEGKESAKHPYWEAIKAGVDPDLITEKAKGYARLMAQEKREPKYIQHASRWLTERKWNDTYPEPPKKHPSWFSPDYA